MTNILRHRGGYEKNNFLNILKDIENYDELVASSSESPYIDPSDVTSFLINHKDKFLVLDINIQSINAMFDKLCIFLRQLAEQDIFFSAICLQETWLSENNFSYSNFSIPNYTSFFLPATCSSHGGLAVYISNSYQVQELNLYTSSKLWEGQFLEIFGGGLKRKITLCNIYRPPRDRNSDIKTFLSEFTPIVSTISNNSPECVISGDFNLDLLKINSRALIADYIELLYSYSFLPSITLPTRLSRRSATLIDQIFLKSSSSNTCGGIILSNLSDHLMPFLCIDLHEKCVAPPKTISYQKCDIDSINKFCQAINQKDFMQYISTSPNYDTELNFTNFKTVIDECVKKYLPFRTVKFNRYKHKLNPWITTGILTSIKNRDKMYRKLKNIDPDTDEYCNLKRNVQTYNNIIKKLIRSSKLSYHNNMFYKHKNDSKKSWSLLNSLIGNSNKKNTLTNLFSINGSFTADQTIIADKLNKFFSNIGNQYASQIPVTDPNAYSTYLTNPPHCQFSFSHVSDQDIIKTISNFKPKSSSGDDNLSLKVLKRIAEKISKPLSILINQSLDIGVFPQALKLAKVIPLYKKDNPYLFNNYRPISLLLSLSKVYEKVVHTQLTSYFTNNNIFLPNQYGFRQK